MSAPFKQPCPDTLQSLLRADPFPHPFFPRYFASKAHETGVPQDGDVADTPKVEIDTTNTAGDAMSLNQVECAAFHFANRHAPALFRLPCAACAHIHAHSPIRSHRSGSTSTQPTPNRAPWRCMTRESSRCGAAPVRRAERTD